ncbi:MAG: type I restriction endonuclease subunit R [Lachnospiraceae bacterium]|nr:type I restriction endonuclease subunit R [Ruminococcus sp.]MCM1276497.1 type I restriction endonuclease subunit R [Lachnospiraceae bacterium]
MSYVKTEYEVEEIFVNQLETQGYTYIKMSNYDDVLANFREQFCKLNKDALIEAKGKAELSHSEFAKIMLRLDNHTIYESAKILREKWVLELDNGSTIYVEFLTDDADRNIYQVTHQITMDKAHKDDVEYKNRYDVTVLINGLPLVQIELKRSGVELNEAVNQINRYRAYSFKGLFRYIQIFVVSNSVQTKYFANANERNSDGTEQFILKSLAFYWTDRNNVRINRLGEFTKDFFDKYLITEMINKFMVIKETEPIVMVMRPYQIYAVKEAMERILGSDLNGFVFHTTGSGKTLTSYKLASLLRDHRNIDKVFFLIDRKDLDDQTVDEYNSFEEGCVDNTDSTAQLVSDLSDTNKTLVITTIQKMANAVKKEKYADIMAQLADKKCVFIIDECHRSQFGKMHGDIKRHFHNSNYIGFTGTPIFKENKGGNNRTTADMFFSGTLDPCIHRYMIKEAIADGNVLRFSVEYMRSINVSRVNINGVDPAKIDDPDYCKSKNIDIDDLYHAPERIDMVSTNILETLDAHIKPSGKDVYTAIFAVDKIQTLMDYYHAFKVKNDKGYKICAIFTFQPNEDLSEGQDEHSARYLQECMDDYNRMFGTSYDLSTFDAYRKDIAKRLKQKDLPQVDLLIVVDMFLTGFDSKPTNTLFLDKNLIYHSLVQAYSRTNRIDKPTKQFGQIVTYRNIKKAQDEALKLFSGSGNPNDYLLESYEYYVAEYSKQVDAIRVICPTSDDCGNLVNEDEQKEFIIIFRQLAKALATMKTFSKFDWADLDVFMDESEYTEYKSWYLTFYDEQKAKTKAGKTTVLADIDFSIELIRTDKINVVYVLNLLKEVNRNDKEEMQKSIDLILREINRSDNEKMRYKSAIMKAFINLRFFDLDPEEDIIKEYEQYEKEVMENDVNEFSENNGVEPELVLSILNEYFVDEHSITKNKIRERIADKHLPLLLQTKLINAIMMFIKDMYDKFTAEGV